MRSRPRGRSILVAITFLLSGTSVYAHHGRDFLLVQTSHIPEQGGLYGLTRQDYTQEEHDEVEVEVAFLFGLLDWMAVEVHGHIEKQSRESPNYESTAPAIHWRFTPRAYAIGVGASVEYAFSNDDEADMVELSGVSAFENEDWIAAFNLKYEKAEGEEEEWGYSAGVRRAVSAGVALGIEITGTFEDEEDGEVLGAIYGDIGDRLTINVGVGAGFNSDVDLTVRTALIWQFN